MYRAFIQNPEYYHEPFYELNGAFEKSNVQYQLPEHTTHFQELQMIPQIPETPYEPLYEPIGALAEPKEHEISLAQENVRKLFDEMQNPKIDASKKNEIGKRLFEAIDVVQSSQLAEHTHQIIEPIPESPPLSSEEMKIREEQMARYQVPVAEFQENRQPVGYSEQPVDYRQSQRYQWAMRIEQAEEEYQEIDNFQPAWEPFQPIYERIPEVAKNPVAPAKVEKLAEPRDVEQQKELAEPKKTVELAEPTIQHPLMDFIKRKSLDTTAVAAAVLVALKSMAVSQSKFAANVLSRTQGTLSDLLTKPLPWEKLKAARKMYLRMDAFLQLTYEDRRKVLAMDAKRAQAALGFEEAAKNKKTSKPRPPRFNYSEVQKATLDRMYSSEPYPSNDKKELMAEQLELTALQINNYFHNCRRREKRQTSEDPEEPAAKRWREI